MELVNPFREFYDSEVYVNYEKLHLPSFPYLLEIEPTNTCNMDCLFCARQIMKRPASYLDYDIYKNIIDEARQYSHFVGISSFSGWGEPLLHKDIFRMIDYANKKNVLTSLISNGLLLKKQNVAKLLNAGVDHVKISLQGANNAEYEKMRKKGVYDSIVRNVLRLVNYRNKNNYRTFIQASTSITSETKKEVNAFVRFWEGIVDEIYVDYTKFQRIAKVDRVKEYLKGKKDIINSDGEIVDEYKMKTYRDKGCVDVNTRLVIHSNCNVPICCSDFSHEMVLGNIKDSTLKEIWDSKKLLEIRNILKRNIKNIPFCSVCHNLR